MPDNAQAGHSPAPVQDEPASTAAALESLGVRGARRLDPMRWHLAEALARRAPRHAGAARGVIEARLAVLVEALAEAVDRAEPIPAHDASMRASSQGPLAALVAHAVARGRPSTGSLCASTSALARTGSPASRAGARSRAALAAPAPAMLAEPPALQYFRRTWSRLNADQRLAQSRAGLPANAGPLNSHHLVHKALVTLHELSPAYLEHFVVHVDDLLWIEAAAASE